MRKITLLLCTVFVLFASGAGAQLFQNFVGKSDPQEYGNSVTQGVDGKYLVGGYYTNSFQSKSFPAVIHLTTTGSVDWVKKIVLPTNNAPATVVYAEAVRSTTGTADGYVAVLNSQSSIFVVRLGNTGTVTWARRLSNGNFSSNYVLKLAVNYSSPTSLPVFYILATHFSGLGEMVIKLNSTGTTLWQKRITNASSGSTFVFRDLKPTNDNGCIVTGYQSGTLSNAILFKFSTTGAVTFAKTYDFFSASSSSGFGVTQLASGGYAVTGFEGSKDNITFQTTSTGTLSWANKYTTAATNHLDGQAVISDASGNVIVGGANYNPTVLNDAFLMKLNSAGTILFAKEYYGHSDFNDLKLTSQGYCFAGTSDPSNVNADIYVVQTNTSGTIASSCNPASVTYTRVAPDFNSVANASFFSVNEVLSNAAITVTAPTIPTDQNRCSSGAFDNLVAAPEIKGKLLAYANAGFSNITVQYKVQGTDNNNYEVKLYNLDGTVFAAAALKANQPVVIQANNLQQGIYMIALTCKGELVAQEKLVITK